MPNLGRLQRTVELLDRSRRLVSVSGFVAEVTPSYFKTVGLSQFVKLGDCVQIDSGEGGMLAQVVRIDDAGTIVKPFDNSCRVGLGSTVRCIGPVRLFPDESWKGRVLDAFARPIDGNGALRMGRRAYSVDTPAPNAMRRAKIGKAAPTGVRAIDAFTPICEGQRIGVFAGSGVGKSTLLEMMAGSEGFSVAVVCLVGERGREVKEFVESLAKFGLAAVVTVVATSDESPMMRRMAPLTATAIAEAFRDDGASVILIVDSITRYAHALREVALASGDPTVPSNEFASSVPA